MKPFYVSLKPFLDHNALPRPVVWRDIFGNDNPIDVEIGFGNGEYLAQVKDNSPGVNYVGFEEYCERINKTLRKLSRTQCGNARVLRIDVRPGLLFLFAPRTIRHVYCLFPPPWPKKSDIKHRLFTRDFLGLVNNRLVDGGDLKIVTDHHPYAQWIMEQVPADVFRLSYRQVSASYGTKFERKWVEGGQDKFDEIILTKIKHSDIPMREEIIVQHYMINRFNPDQFKMSDYSDGNIAVAFKDFLYDPKRETALVYVLVHDEHLLQNVRIVVMKEADRWRINLAQGTILMPTAGIAKALECVKEACVATEAPC